MDSNQIFIYLIFCIYQLLPFNIDTFIFHFATSQILIFILIADCFYAEQPHCIIFSVHFIYFINPD